MVWVLRRYTVAMWLLLGARPVENRLEEALTFAQLLQFNPLVRGVRLGNIAGTANDALHAGALELARFGAVGDLLRCVVGAEPLVGEAHDGRVVFGAEAGYSGVPRNSAR